MVTGPRLPIYQNQVMPPDIEKVMVKKKNQTNQEQNKHTHLQI